MVSILIDHSCMPPIRCLYLVETSVRTVCLPLLVSHAYVCQWKSIFGHLLLQRKKMRDWKRCWCVDTARRIRWIVCFYRAPITSCVLTAPRKSTCAQSVEEIYKTRSEPTWVNSILEEYKGIMFYGLILLLPLMWLWFICICCIRLFHHNGRNYFNYPFTHMYQPLITITLTAVFIFLHNLRGVLVAGKASGLSL